MYISNCTCLSVIFTSVLDLFQEIYKNFVTFTFHLYPNLQLNMPQSLPLVNNLANTNSFPSHYIKVIYQVITIKYLSGIE